MPFQNRCNLLNSLNQKVQYLLNFSRIVINFNSLGNRRLPSTCLLQFIFLLVGWIVLYIHDIARLRFVEESLTMYFLFGHRKIRSNIWCCPCCIESKRVQFILCPYPSGSANVVCWMQKYIVRLELKDRADNFPVRKHLIILTVEEFHSYINLQ